MFSSFLLEICPEFDYWEEVDMLRMRESVAAPNESVERRTGYKTLPPRNCIKSFPSSHKPVLRLVFWTRVMVSLSAFQKPVSIGDGTPDAVEMAGGIGDGPIMIVL